MLKSVLFLFLICIASLHATPAKERIDIHTDICSLSESQILALREALDDSIWDLLPQEGRAQHEDLHQSAKKCTSLTQTLLGKALEAARIRAEGKILVIDTQRPVHLLISHWAGLLQSGKRALSAKPEYRCLFLESELVAYGRVSQEGLNLRAFRERQGILDDQGTFLLDPQTDAHIKTYFEKVKKIVNKLGVLCLGSDLKEGIFSCGDHEVCYIKDATFMIRKKGFFSKVKVSNFELMRSQDGPEFIAKGTYLLEKNPEGEALLVRKCSYLAHFTKSAVAVNTVGPVDPTHYASEYAFVPGEQPASSAIQGHIKQNLYPTDGSPQLRQQQAIFDFVSHLFAPLLRGTPLQDMLIPVPLGKLDRLSLEMRFLEELLEAKTQQATRTALVPPAIAEEIQIIETVLAEKQTQLKQTFEEENPDFLQKAQHIWAQQYDDEWAQRKEQVIQGIAGAPKNQRKKKLGNLAQEEAQWKQNRAQALQNRQNEGIQKKLNALKKESQGSFKLFYEGVKTWLQGQGIDAHLTQTGNGGSHNHKIEFHTPSQSLGSVIVPNKPITPNLLNVICQEISQLSKRLFG